MNKIVLQKIENTHALRWGGVHFCDVSAMHLMSIKCVGWKE